jgi:hypothetical protein
MKPPPHAAVTTNPNQLQMHATMAATAAGGFGASASGGAGSSGAFKSRLVSDIKQPWKTNDERAQKSGAHKTITWVQKIKPATPSAGFKKSAAVAPTYKTGICFTGEWHDNHKQGASLCASFPLSMHAPVLTD